MIATLFADEFRTTRKTILPSIGIMLAIIIAGYLVAALKLPIIGGIGMSVGIAASIALTPAVLALLVAHYWRTMYGAQGYFTMTIPVRGRTIFAAKVLYGFVAAAVALALTVGMLLLAGIAHSLSQGAGPLDFLREGFAFVEPRTVWLAAAGFLLFMAYTVVSGATAMSVGAESRFSHLGFGAPVIFMVILYFAMQLVGLAAMVFVPFGVRLTGPDAGSFVAEGMMRDLTAALADPSAEPGVLGLGIVPVFVLAAIALAWWGATSVDRRTSLR